jgi:hypothetical protein
MWIWPSLAVEMTELKELWSLKTTYRNFEPSSFLGDLLPLYLENSLSYQGILGSSNARDAQSH